MLHCSYLVAVPPQPLSTFVLPRTWCDPPLAATGRITRGAEWVGSVGRKRVATAVRSPLFTRTGQDRLERRLRRKGRATYFELEASRLVSWLAVSSGQHVVACAHVLSWLLVVHTVTRTQVISRSALARTPVNNGPHGLDPGSIRVVGHSCYLVER